MRSQNGILIELMKIALMPEKQRQSRILWSRGCVRLMQIKGLWDTLSAFALR
jgi:hypothetical protein